MESEGIKKNQSLRKALTILEQMTLMEGPSRLQDIAERARMAPSTVSRFLNTYIDFGYVKQDPKTSFYFLTLKLAELGARNKAHFPYQQMLAKYVKEVSKQFNESSSLCIENDMQMVYIVTEDGPRHMLQTLQRIGRVAPMHATGVGKLHLLNYSESRLIELEQKRGFNRLTSHTLTTLEAVKREIETIRKQEYALDDEECEEGVRCIAVPIRDYTGDVVAAISLSAPLTRLDMRRTNEIIAYLTDVKLRASRELGWTPASQN
jgi:IclR family KDG regulon transcriptional repressor